jgi:hypothetical protein
MEPLMWVAIVVYIASFFLIVRFSRNRYKYHNSNMSESASLRAWKVLGVRTYYYRLVAATSGIITMIVVAVFKFVL